MNPPRLRFCAVLAALAFLGVRGAVSQRPSPRPFLRPTPGGPVRATIAVQPSRKASDLLRKQDPIKINSRVLDSLTPDRAHVIVSIPRQRAYLFNGDDLAIDSPVSSGKRGHSTPTGSFTVMEKDINHHSSLYGDFRDRSGRIVRAGVSANIDSAPSGTHFVGAEMKWFMRLTGEGVGMHVGILPGYPASHGCIRMPSQAAELFYNHVKIGTPVEVQP